MTGATAVPSIDRLNKAAPAVTPVTAVTSVVAATEVPAVAAATPRAAVAAKTADRHILGTINDLAFTIEHVIAAAGGLARCDIDALHRTINSITGYIPPINLITANHQGQR
ncbi:hypothetical protein [Mycobacterium riyadhense]|nr:hypothetical protein [Mycobacterium riyadhense]